MSKVSNFARRKVQRRSAPRAVTFTPQRTGDERIDRQFDEVATAIDLLGEGPRLIQLQVEESGLVKVAHGLGEPPRAVLNAGANKAGLSFHHRQAENPAPHRELWLEFVVAEPTTVTLMVA